MGEACTLQVTYPEFDWGPLIPTRSQNAKKSTYRGLWMNAGLRNHSLLVAGKGSLGRANTGRIF